MAAVHQLAMIHGLYMWRERQTIGHPIQSEAFWALDLYSLQCMLVRWPRVLNFVTIPNWGYFRHGASATTYREGAQSLLSKVRECTEQNVFWCCCAGLRASCEWRGVKIYCRDGITPFHRITLVTELPRLTLCDE